MDTNVFEKICLGVFGVALMGTGAAVVRALKCGLSQPQKETEKKENKENKEAGELIKVDTLWKNRSTEKKPNPLVCHKDKKGDRCLLGEDFCVSDSSFTISKTEYKSEKDLVNATRYVKAGIKPFIYYDPAHVKAAIVTCGGLCPGENVCIRELVNSLYNYGVTEVYGVLYGYMGFYYKPDGKECYVKLIPHFGKAMEELPPNTWEVRTIHNLGGTILGSSRGGFDAIKIVDSLISHGFNQVYAIGGDGTHRGLLALSQECNSRGVKISVMGIPKTIDNDMPLLDKTFGFDSAIEAALYAIENGNIEATSAEYGVGLVKVMGRSAGHIAMRATLASRDVNICLVPEFQFDIYGANGLLEFIMNRLKTRHHCLIVVAEGAASAIRDVKISDHCVKDASGNTIPADIGPYLKETIVNYGRKFYNMDITLKYIDPSYTVRAVPANSSDRDLCAMLCENAVHAAMAGYTNCTVGTLRSVPALIPFDHITRASAHLLKFSNLHYQRMLQSTGQPLFLNDL